MSNTSVMLSTASTIASPLPRAVEITRPGDADHVLVITPPKRWSALDLRELWRFRDLFFTFASRDLKLRYKQTALGVVWVVFQPLLTSLVFVLVFQRIAKMESENNVPYFLFAFSALLGWNMFNTVLSRSSACLINNAHMISKIYFPRMVLPASTMGAALVDMVVALALFLVMLPFYHMGLHWSLLLLPVWTALLVVMALGIGLYAAALTVSYRDVQYVLPVVLNTAMYATPIGYSLVKAGPRMKMIVNLNPLTGIIEAFRWSLVPTAFPQTSVLCYSIAWALGVLLFGAMAFKQMERKFADVI